MSNNNRNIIKNTLNTYLKQKNYPINERFRKSDLVLTQSKEDYLMDLKIRNEITRTNSFTFSNISSLNGSQSPVDQQVNKLVKFIQCQKNSLVRKELQNLLPPLICHLFVEMLKGKEWKPAHEFLRKYSSLLGTFQEIPPQKVNGTDPSTLMPHQIHFLPHSNNPSSQMRFASTSKQIQIAQLTIEEQKLSLFREIVTNLSSVRRLEDTKDNKMIINFRSCKYKAQLSRKSLAILNKYLEKHGHVLIIQVFHVWFSWDLYELHEDSNDSSSPSSPEMLANNNNFDFTLQDNSSARLQRNNVNRFSECDNQKDIKFNFNNNRLDSPAVAQKDQQNTNYELNESETNELFGSNLKLKRLHDSLNRVNNKYHKPIRIFNINYTENSLCTATVDKSLCHMAAGLEDSTVVLWSLNGYENYGRKPFQSFDDRLCQWSINNCNRVLTDDLSDFESDEDIEDNLNDLPNESEIETERLRCSNGINRDFQSYARTFKKRKSGNKYRTKISMRKQWSDFNAKSCSENNFSLDSQSIVLRGHRNSVTDVLFGKQENILLSTSRDKTFRLWKADSYTCACVYRGHEFPIWCIDESSNGCYAVTGSKDTTARLWSYERKFPVKIYPGHSQDVDCIAFHPNGNYFATGSADTTIRMWCVTSGKLLRIFTECHLPVNTISFSPDGKLLAAAGDETKIRIFDLATGQQLLDLKNHTASVKSLSWSSSSKKLLSGCSDGSFYVWNINNNLGLSSSTNSSSKDSKSSSLVAGTSRNSAGSSTSIGETSKPSSSSIPASGSSSPMSSLIQSNSTGCKRIVKVFFHGPGELVHAIGND